MVYNGYMKKIRILVRKIFGELNITWPIIIISAIIIGIYTALVAMLVPDGNSFHDIAVTLEWWVLPAILIIVNSKKPLEAALKTFVFFLISQPLVYLIQVPFNSMGWELFRYYPYWLVITLFTFPAAFVGWYMKKDKWYSGVILSAAAVLLVYSGYRFALDFNESFPNHLITVIYCFGIIPVFIFGIFKDKIPRIITGVVSVVTLIVMIMTVHASVPFETYNSMFLEDNDITFVTDNPYIASFDAENEGNVTLIKYDGGYTLKVRGIKGKTYAFSIRDGETEYDFEYYQDAENETVVIVRK